MCLLFVILLLGPRAAVLLWWLFEPVRWSAAFDTILIPLLGFLFLPWTIFMYILVGVDGITGWDWLWMGMALLIDLGSYMGGYMGRGNIPQYGYRQ